MTDCEWGHVEKGGEGGWGGCTLRSLLTFLFPMPITAEASMRAPMVLVFSSPSMISWQHDGGAVPQWHLTEPTALKTCFLVPAHWSERLGGWLNMCSVSSLALTVTITHEARDGVLLNDRRQLCLWVGHLPFGLLVSPQPELPGTSSTSSTPASLIHPPPSLYKGHFNSCWEMLSRKSL